MGWDTVIYLVISVLISYATRPKPGKPAPPAAFEDFDFPQSAEGTARAVIFGDVWTNDWMVLGVGNYRHQPIRK